MTSMDVRKLGRLKRKKRIRKKIYGTVDKPRLCVFRSAKHIYAQIIDDTAANTIIAASTLDKEVLEHSDFNESKDGIGVKTARADLVGRIVGAKAIEKGIKKIVFDRNGFLYHGRVKAVSDGARKAGLRF